MAITWADVEAIAPSLSTVPVGAQAILIAYVEETVDEGAFVGATSYLLAKAYLAAHYGSLTLSAGTGRAVSSESAGGISRSYVVPALTGDVGSTEYGRAFQSLVRASPARVMVLCP